MFMFYEWLLAMKESGNSSVKFLQDTTLSCIPSSTIHEYKCSAQIMLHVLSCAAKELMYKYAYNTYFLAY